MKKIGPSQIGLSILVAVVFVRGFLVGDAPIYDIFKESVQPLASNLQNDLLNVDEEDFKFLANHSISRSGDVDEFNFILNPVATVSDVVVTNEEPEDLEDELYASADVGSGLDDAASGMPMELALFTPTFNESEYSGEEEESVPDVVPLDAGNTITNDWARMFPITSPH